MIVFILALVFAGIPLLALFAFYIYRKFFCHNYFKKLGIPGPEPHWFYGNLHQLWATDQRHLLVAAWSKQYGRYFGYYEGGKPVLVTSSTDGVEQICVRQFQSFPGRRLMPIFPDPSKFPESPFSNTGSTSGEQWKRLRTIASPCFSTSKLRAYSPLIAKSQQELEHLFAEKAASKESFEMFKQLQYLALDVIGEVAFGIEVNSVKNRGVDNPILPKFQGIISAVANEPTILKLCYALPAIAPILQKLMVRQMKTASGVLAPIFSLANLAASVIAQRRADPSLRRNDLLQMLIDATASVPSSMMTRAEEATPSPARPLTEIEATSQVVHFFTAGANTTSGTLSYAAFVLATNFEAQEKIYQEIVTFFPDQKSKPDYDTVMKMPYLHWFIYETMRLYPMTPLILTRVLSEETEIAGIPLTKRSMMAQIDVQSIHQDPELWGPVDPAIFYPERFSPDYPTTATRPSSAFLGFGYGPRICLGIKFAVYEMKLTLITLVRRFRVIEREGGYPDGRLPVKVSTVMLPTNGVWVRLEERENSRFKASS